MNDITTGAEAPSGGEAAPGTTLPLAPPKGDGELTIRQAAEQYAKRRAEGAKLAETTEQPQRAPDGKFAAAQKSDPQGEDAARPQDATGETQEGDPAETPPLELPRSWSKDKAEHWNGLSRDMQEYLLDHDKTTSAEVRRTQNEAAETRKAAEAERQAATQARTQYEQAAQNALSVLQQQLAADFGDIKTDADVMKLATDDPFRFSQWQARQMQIQRQGHEVMQLNQQREQERSKTFDAWSKEQDDKFSKQFSEFSDPEKGPKVRAGVTSYLTKEVGVPEEALQKLWNTDLFRDAMWQRVVYDASRFHAAQQAAKSAVQAQKPQVQRPGTVSTKAERSAVDIGALEKKLDSATSTRSQIAAAAALRAAKRAASAH